MKPTYEITDRNHFAAIVRTARAARTLISYGRLPNFGRSIITTDYRAIFPYWNPRPPMNIHRTTGDQNR
jgi:hypothetical protein